MMDLFSPQNGDLQYLLPHDGVVEYHGLAFTKAESDMYYEKLMSNIEWQHDQANMFGKIIVTKRKVGWYGEKPFNYTYSKVTKQALPQTEELLNLKARAEELTNFTYNSCLLNLYHDGSEGMAYHSDGEKDLQENGAIASLSFGAERKFAFKHKTTKQKIDVHFKYIIYVVYHF